ncbi:helicase [Nocardia sp. SYP-A9097]|uniref:DEAD/DEAH box helicase n=1 Tax=Nocardia sp. SYP-A9097 TaxID=2663237 RepID=UPI00129BA1B1|nr:helicase [Nocardia sp. SYP-A9097]
MVPSVNRAELTIADHCLATYFDELTFHRGLNYAERGKAGSIVWAAEDLALIGEVSGSGGALYQTAVRFARSLGVLEIIDCDCTCPVGYDCKHAAAIVLSACVPASMVGPDPGRPVWEEAVESLLPGRTDAETIDLGIQFTVRQAKPSSPGMIATIRPVQPGRTGWVAGNLSWGSLRYHYGGRLNPDHVQILREIHALSQSGNAYSYYGTEKTINLSSFDSPRLWTLLETAKAAGVALVQGKRAFDDEPIIGSARYCVDVEQQAGSGDLLVTPAIRVDGCSGAIVPIAFVGATSHGLVYAEAADITDFDRPDKSRLRLARLDRPVPDKAQRMLTNSVRLTIPEHDRSAFLAQYYPRLRLAANMTSADESFTAPEISGPELMLEVTYGSEPRVDARWQWSYRIAGTEHRADLGPRTDTHFRDIAAESRILTELIAPFEKLDLGTLDPRTLGSRPTRLTGVAGLRFVTELLPLLREQPDVQIDAKGPAPDYRDTDDALVIEVSTEENGSGTDWFDLGITISAAGQQVPFLDVFTALNTDDTHLILPSGAYFSLDNPQLRSLRRLIDEARTMQDVESGGLRISRFQAGLWQEFAALGVVGAQADGWRRQVQGLPDIESADAPALPTDFTAHLRPYQQDGYAWLSFLWRHRLGGILADDMGLGKTVQVLALICAARQQTSDADPWLIIAPASVVANWAAESARFAPGLRRVAVSDTLRRSGRTMQQITAEADIIVTSYTLLRLDFDAYSAHSWSGLILDEAQFVKNHQSKVYQCARRITAPFKLAVTGTPMKNNLMELWALLSITAPGLFPHPNRFREYYAGPIEKSGNTELLAQLRRRIKPLLLRRTKEQVATDLPEKQEQVLEVALTPKHRKLYDTHLQRERQKVLGLVDDMNRNRFTILRSLTLLRQLSLHAGLIDDSHHAVASAKIDVLTEHLHEVVDGGHRALVFSQFTGFLAHVRARLDTEGIEYCYLDGRTRKRQAVIERFRGGSAPVFLISLKAGGFGLNLTEADYCFLLDPWWNPATEEQAVDRTHRIGQTRNVVVYRLIAEGTIEHKVMDLKSRKSALFNGVLDDENGGFAGRLDAEDIRALFG